MEQRKKRSRLNRKPSVNPIIKVGAWWGHKGWRLDSAEGETGADLATGKISNFDPTLIRQYPVFKNPTLNFDAGEPLCKIGYPFYSVETFYDSENDKFTFPDNTFPIPYFPMDGILTRIGVVRDSVTKFVETSSPGLQGQSGGPTFDTRGRVWALQSGTKPYPLGFEPQVPRQQRTEHQFLNAGWGTHVETIIEYLKQKNIKFSMSDD